MKKKFMDAFRGIKVALKSKSIQLQFCFALIAIIASIIFKFTFYENLIVGLCIALVLSLEIINESIERLCDRVTTDFDDQIKQVKDLSAAAVLVASGVSLILGVLMILNHL